MTTDLTIDQVMWQLNYCDDEFPVTAIQVARERITEIIPRLIECIDEATEDSEDLIEVATWGHIPAMFLLAEFGVKEAFPSILKSMCSECVEQLYGDLITENFSYIITALASDPEEFAVEINDPNIDEYVRGAFVDAVFGMVCEERIPREQAVTFLRNRLNLAIEDQDSHIVTKCVETLGHLVAHEALDEVRFAESRDLIEVEWNGPKYFAEQLAMGQDAFQEACAEFRKRKQYASLDALKSMLWFKRSRNPNLNLESALDAIKEPFTRFPFDAVRWARSHRDEITPHLLQILGELPKSAAENEVESHGHIIAVFLLTEFGVSAALPSILAILNDESAHVSDYLIDLMDGELGQVLGRLADAPEQLAILIDNPELADHIHEEAISAIPWMVTENRLDRDSAIAWLRERFETIRHTDQTERCECFALAFAALGATSCMDVVTDAVEAGQIDPDLIEIGELLDEIETGHQAFENTKKLHRRVRIEQTVVTLGRWDWDESDGDDSDELEDDDYEPGNENIGISPATIRAMMKSYGMSHSDKHVQNAIRQMQGMMDVGVTPASDRSDEVAGFNDAPVATIKNTKQKVGRNDPCPCGSGKKYKKCCAKGE